MYYIYGVICHRLTSPLTFTVKHLANCTQNIIIIHVDKKLGEKEFNLMKKCFSSLSNVLFLEERHDVRWGSISQIDVMLMLLKKAQDYDFKYISLISGDDIPLMSNKTRNNFLDIAYENRAEFIGTEADCKKYYNRINIKHPSFMFKKDRSFLKKMMCKIINLYNRKYNKLDLTNFPEVYKGAQWFTISNFAVDYIFKYLRLNKDYYNYFLYSFCGDEIFFQTILFNSDFKKNIKFDDNESIMSMRYIDWVSGPDYPRTLNEDDFEKIKNSQMLFARKIKSDSLVNLVKYLEI